MLGPNCDFVPGRLDHLPLFPFLFVGDQSSLNEAVVEEVVHDIVVPVIDLSGDPLAAAYDVLAIQNRSCLALPTLQLSFSL